MNNASVNKLNFIQRKKQMVAFFSAPTLLKQRIRKHFENLTHDKRWQNVVALMLFSPDAFFDRIYSELEFLAQKKGIKQIRLLDLVFLSHERLIISTYITGNAVPLSQATLENAVLCNSVTGVSYLAQQGLQLTINTLDFAVSNGRLACVRDFVRRGIIPDNDTLHSAVLISGHLPTIRYLVEECGIQPTLSTIDASIIGGQHAANLYLIGRLRRQLEPVRDESVVLKA